MSDDNQYAEHHDSKPPGMSTGNKVLLIALGVLGVLCVACCGGGILFFRKNFDMKTSTDAAVVKETQRGILDAQVPAGFDPKQSMKMKFFVANMAMAMFEASGSELSQLAFMKMTFTGEQMNQQQVEEQFNQQNPGSAQLNERESETRNYTVDGKEISVTFAHGTLREGGREGGGVPADQVGKEWYEVTSIIPVPGGMVMFNMAGPETEFDEEEIENMIKSIRFPDEEAE